MISIFSVIFAADPSLGRHCDRVERGNQIERFFLYSEIKYSQYNRYIYAIFSGYCQAQLSSLKPQLKKSFSFISSFSPTQPPHPGKSSTYNLLLLLLTYKTSFLFITYNLLLLFLKYNMLLLFLTYNLLLLFLLTYNLLQVFLTYNLYLTSVYGSPSYTREDSIVTTAPHMDHSQPPPSHCLQIIVHPQKNNGKYFQTWKKLFCFRKPILEC